MSERPLTEVFKSRIRGAAHLVRFVAPGMDGFDIHEPLYMELDEDGDNPTINAWRDQRDDHNHHQGVIVIGNITPKGVADVVYGDEQVINSEVIGSFERTIDNTTGVRPEEVSLSDLFSQSKGHEDTHEQSSGGSVEVSVEATESIEGVAEFTEAVTSEVHTEVTDSETSSSESGREAGGEESTVVPEGYKVKFVKVITREDVAQDVSARGEFGHTIDFVNVCHRCTKAHQWRNRVNFDSWEQFCDVIRDYENQPDNYPLVQALKDRHPYHADLWALADLDTEVKYRVKFEGRIKTEFRTETLAKPEGAPDHSLA